MRKGTSRDALDTMHRIWSKQTEEGAALYSRTRIFVSFSFMHIDIGCAEWYIQIKMFSGQLKYLNMEFKRADSAEGINLEQLAFT